MKASLSNDSKDKIVVFLAHIGALFFGFGLFHGAVWLLDYLATFIQ